MMIGKILKTSVFIGNSFLRTSKNSCRFVNFFNKPAVQLSPKLSKDQTSINLHGIQQRINKYMKLDKLDKDEFMKILTIVIQDIDKQLYSKHRQSFAYIHLKIIQNGSQLILLPHQLVTIILAFEKLQNFQPVSLTKIFRKKIVYMATHFMVQNKFSLTQAIAIYHSLCNTKDTITLSFLIHFNTFLKKQLNQPNKTIHIDEIITIFNTFFINSHHNTLQHIMINTVYKYLIDNIIILRQTAIEQQIQLFKNLAATDSIKFYLTQEEQEMAVIHIIMQKIKSNLISLNHEKQLLLTYSVQILSVFKNIEIRQSRNDRIGDFLQQIDKNMFQMLMQIEQGKTSQNLIRNNLNSIIQLVFSRKYIFDSFFARFNIFDSKIFKIISQNNSTSKIYQRIICLYRQSQQSQSKAVLMQILDEVHNKLKKSENINFQIFSLILQVQKCQKMKQIDSCMDIVGRTSEFKEAEDSLRMAFTISINTVDNNSLALSRSNIKQVFNLSLIDSFTSKYPKDSIKVFKIINDIVKTQKRQAKIKKLMNKIQPYISHGIILESINKLNSTQGQSISQIVYFLIYYHYYNQSTDQTKKLLIQLLAENENQAAYNYLLSLFPKTRSLNTNETNQCSFLIVGDLNDKIQYLTKLINQPKFAYLFWELFLKYYSKKSIQQRTKYLILTKKLFRQMYERQGSRKIVVLTHFSTLLAQNIIIDSNNQLALMVVQYSEEILKSNQDFHYHCWLQMVFNLHSLGLLKLDLFHHIVKAFTKTNKKSVTQSTLYRFYILLVNNHMTRLGITSFQGIRMADVENQLRNIDRLLNNKAIRVNLIDNLDVSSADRTYKYKIGSKFICILLESNRPIVWLLPQILSFIKECSFRQTIQILNSLKTKNSLNPQMQIFLNELNVQIKNKLLRFKDSDLITQLQFKQYLNL